jgi:23S rRNA (uracil1939-C5)-methyltransferase
MRALTVEEFLRDFKPGRDVFDVAIVNPPRHGLGEAVARAFASLAIPRVVMVSCDSGSLARDLKPMLAAGYVAKRVVPVDQFPGTPHVETVVRLDRI